MNEFLKEILPISVVLTFIGTLFTIYYTRRNLKTTKYIETITSERIKWLDTLRKEVTNIITNIYFTLNVYDEKINSIEDGIDEGKYVNTKHLENYLNTETTSALGEKSSYWSKSDFIYSLNLLKLRLNPEEDTNIIEIIDFFTCLYSDSEFVSAEKVQEAKDKVGALIAYTQELLKQEWEKVKIESRGKVKRR